MFKPLAAWLKDERGATAIEYGVLAALLSVVIIATVTSLEHGIEAKYNTISNALK